MSDKLRDIEERLKAATGDLFRTGEGTYATLIAHAPDDLAYLLRVARAAERLEQQLKDLLADGVSLGLTPEETTSITEDLAGWRRALEGDADGK